MEKLTINTLEKYKAFCETEKEKEKDFLAKKGDAYYYKAYRYYENYTNTNEFNLLDMLIDDEDFLNFPLDLEIIENPMMVEIFQGKIVFFEDRQKAFDYANKLFKDGIKNVIIEGHGLAYEYIDDFYFLNLNESNKDILTLIKR